VRKYMSLLSGLFLLVVLLPEDIHSCTTFCLKDKNGHSLFGRNFDFPTGLGQVHINQRNLQKTSFIAPPEKPFGWVAKYGSISFNQNGREFPYGGMNEAGLVIEQMMHDEAIYPARDERYGLEELQWIQYQLDVSASVAEVMASDRIVRISNTSIAPLHFLVSDSGGNVATIEYVGGKMVHHTGKDLKYPVLSNDTYDVSLDYKANIDAGSAKAFSERTRSYSDRFAKAAAMIEAYGQSKAAAVDYAFAILEKVSQGGTQWSIVYDMKKGAIYYRTRHNKNIRHIALRLFDFSCASERLFADIEEDIGGLSDFKAYNYGSNLKLIESAWSAVEFLKQIPGNFRTSWAKYPDSVRCIKAD